MLNTFYYQLKHTTLKNVELLKHSKIDKNAPTCFGLHGNHLQGAKVSTWLKVTRLVDSRCVEDVQGLVSATAAYCDCNKGWICMEYVNDNSEFIQFFFIILNYHLHIPYKSFITVTICSHSTDDALHIFHASTVNQTCNF